MVLPEFNLDKELDFERLFEGKGCIGFGFMAIGWKYTLGVG